MEELLKKGESYNVDSVEETPARLGSDVSLYCRLSGNGAMRWERPDGQPLNRARQEPMNYRTITVYIF